MTIVYKMVRAGKQVAEVVTMSSGKCVVSWPTSVVVYDTEQAARAVHIEHMGSRGEETRFELVWTDSHDYQRGWSDCAQDDCEGCPFASIGGLEARSEPQVPKYSKPIEDATAYLWGYIGYAQARYGVSWRTCEFSYQPALVIGAEEHQ